TILFITHRLREVCAVADRVTLLRGGKAIVSRATADADPAELAALIVGERIEERRPAALGSTGPVVLRVEALAAADDTGFIAVREATFEVRVGEIVAIAGVEGSGQRELVETIVGLRRPAAGDITLDGRPIAARSVRERRALGMAYISA